MDASELNNKAGCIAAGCNWFEGVGGCCDNAMMGCMEATDPDQYSFACSVKAGEDTVHMAEFCPVVDCYPCKCNWCCCPGTPVLSPPLGRSIPAADTSGGTQGEPTDEGSFLKTDCSCTCDGKTIETNALSYAGRIKEAEDENMVHTKCRNQCARTCGGVAACPEAGKGCPQCCETFCSEKYIGGPGADYESAWECQKACRNTCDVKSTLNEIIDAFYLLAGILGGLMLVIHGVRMTTSDDEGGRRAAKSSIAYVIIALLIIAVGGAIVKGFLGLLPKII